MKPILQSTINPEYNMELRTAGTFHYDQPGDDAIMFNNDLIMMLGKDVTLRALGGSLILPGRFETYTYPPMQRFSVTEADGYYPVQYVFNYNEIKAVHYPRDARFYSGQDFIIELH